mgnify:CR=1 FL=1
MKKVILSRKAEQVLRFTYCRGKIYVEISEVFSTYGGAVIRWYRQYIKRPIYY